MSKNLKYHLRNRLARLLSGLVFGGIFLFQGTGFITGRLAAADNQNVDVTPSGAIITSTSYNTGLTGTASNPGSAISGGPIIINGGTSLYTRTMGVVGKLPTAGLNPTLPVEIRMGQNGLGNYYDILIGATSVASPLGGYGSLLVSGTATEASKLITGGTLIISDGGLLTIGGDGIYGTAGNKGVVQILNGGSISNFGENEDTGIYIGTGGTLILGNGDDDRFSGGMDTGNGYVTNTGTITVYNETGNANEVSFITYADASKGLLTATGNLLIGNTSGAGTLQINGKITADNLYLMAANGKSAEKVTLNSGGNITATGLLSLGDDRDPVYANRVGASLQIKADSLATVGGLKAVAVTAGTKSYGGSLTLDAKGSGTSAGRLTVLGLAEKFNTAGQQTTEGLFDIWLGRQMVNNGTIYVGSLASPIGQTGLYFTGDTAATTAIDGFTNAGVIASYGDMNFYGANFTADTTKKTIARNSGTFYVDGDLALGYDSATTGGLRFINTGTTEVVSLTLADAKISVESTGSDAIFYVNTMNLQNGLLGGAFTGYLYTDSNKNETAASITLGIDTGGTDVGATETQLMANTSFGSYSATTEGKTTFRAVGEGKVTGDYTLTFTDTDVINDSALIGTQSAFGLKGMIFGAGSSYTGGKTVNSDMTFTSTKAAAVLVADVDNPLTLGANKNLTVGGGGVIQTRLTDEMKQGGTQQFTTQIQLLGEGTANLAGGTIAVENLAAVSKGIYSTRLVATEAIGGNNFNANFSTAESAFFHITEDKGNDYYDLTFNVKSFTDFGNTFNRANEGAYIDTFRSGENYSDALRNLVTGVMQLKTDAEVGAAFDTLSGVSRANGLILGMNTPWQTPFDQIQWQSHRRYTPNRNGGGMTGLYRGQSPDTIYEEYDAGRSSGHGEYGEYIEETSPYDGSYHASYDGGQRSFRSILSPNTNLAPNNVWGAFGHTSMTANSDGNSAAYGISRTGVTLGYDMIDEGETMAGVAFSYSQPYLYTDDAKIEATCFNLGLYGKRELPGESMLKVYFGGGSVQSVHRRNVDLDAMKLHERYRSVSNGGSLAGAIRLQRDIPVGMWNLLRPIVQLDAQQVWQGSSQESTLVGTGAAALRYGSANWGRAFVRAGLETEYNNQFMRFTSRALYAGQIAGNRAPGMTGSFMGDGSGQSMMIRGVDLEGNFLDVGVGAIGYLDCEYRWGVSANYDYTVGKNSHAHTGTVSLSWAL